MLVAGYYVFMLAVRVSAHPHFVCGLNNLSIYKRISFKFCICIYTNNVPLGIVNGQISIIYHRVLALVSVRKNGFWPLVPLLIIWSIMMKLHENARNNKSSILT